MLPNAALYRFTVAATLGSGAPLTITARNAADGTRTPPFHRELLRTADSSAFLNGAAWRRTSRSDQVFSGARCLRSPVDTRTNDPSLQLPTSALTGLAGKESRRMRTRSSRRNLSTRRRVPRGQCFDCFGSPALAARYAGPIASGARHPTPRAVVAPSPPRPVPPSKPRSVPRIIGGRRRRSDDTTVPGFRPYGARKPRPPHNRLVSAENRSPDFSLIDRARGVKALLTEPTHPRSSPEDVKLRLLQEHLAQNIRLLRP